MKNTLYRIETTMRLENPELSGSVMITCNGGILFAELHPVRLKAKVKEPCEFCTFPPPTIHAFATTPAGQEVRSTQPRYCFNCGRRLPDKEAQP